MTRKLTTLGVSALAVFLTVSAADRAQAQADFFRGKQLEMIIGSDPGGGFDLFGRIVARYMPKYLPGQPTMTPKNMPGAGSLKALQYIDKLAAKDGTSIGILNPSILTLAATDPSKVEVDLNKMNWIGNLSSDNKVCMSWTASGIASLDDLKTKKFRAGGTSTSAGSFPPMAILKEFYPNVQHVLGYVGNQDVWLAMERGEVEGHCTGWGIIPAQKPEWVSGKKVTVLSKFTDKEIPGLPGVPSIYTLPMSAEMKNAIGFIMKGDEITRPFFVGAAVPADRVTALRDAFDKMIKDPEFIDAAQKARLEIDTMDYKNLTEAVKTITTTPAAAVQLAKKFIGG